MRDDSFVVGGAHFYLIETETAKKILTCFAQPESLISFAFGYNNFHPDREWARFFFRFRNILVTSCHL